MDPYLTPGRTALKDSIAMTIDWGCLGRTCLQWGPDGELTALDLNLVLERLARVNSELTAQPQQTFATILGEPDRGLPQAAHRQQRRKLSGRGRKPRGRVGQPRPRFPRRKRRAAGLHRP